jgi:predicted membrane-bound spermidine synthase
MTKIPRWIIRYALNAMRLCVLSVLAPCSLALAFFPFRLRFRDLRLATYALRYLIIILTCSEFSAMMRLIPNFPYNPSLDFKPRPTKSGE